MANIQLSRAPHSVGPQNRVLAREAWWYEETGGISVYIDRNGTVSAVKIPWRSIRAALRRKDCHG
jgi:hypothetical protein